MYNKFNPEIFVFVNDLKENNDREWFNNHKVRFKKLEKFFKLYIENLLANMRTHDDIESAKVFRIYRDVRFSKNKLPYKTHFSAAFVRRKPQLRGGYYLHLEPDNKSFLGVGFWDPNTEDLLRIRKEFEMDAEEFKSVINQPQLKGIWGNIEGESLKTAPRDFDKNHPDIELIRMKQYIFTKYFNDEEVFRGDFIEQVNDSFKAIRPFFDLMSDVLTTNLNGETII
jgi:uncharacterized protein (TIGR02453 family)